MPQLTVDNKRNIAAGAVRSICRERKYTEVTVKDAYLILDDLTRSDPQLLASRWYMSASKAQLAKFAREWKWSAKHYSFVSDK